jgi:CRP-like cAMP-binding protein
MSGVTSYAAKLELLKHVPDPLRSEIVPRLRVNRATKGRTLVERGSRTTEVFFLVEGRAEVVVYSANGREVCINTISPGAMFGEIAALDGEPRSASIVASSDAVLIAMRASDFLACLEKSPAAGLWLAQRLAAHTRRLTDQVFELSALNVRARIHSELLRLARQGEQRTGMIEIRPAPTHAEIAKRIGTHREAVTRELRALSGLKIIRYTRQSLIILDLARLEQEAQR